MPSRSGRALHGASARLTRSPGAEPSRVGSVSPLYGALLRVLFCRPVRHPLRGSLPQTRRAWRGRQLSARIDSVGDCPCAVGCEEGFASYRLLLAPVDVVDLEDFRVTRMFERNVSQKRHDALAERFQFLLRVPHFAH